MPLRPEGFDRRGQGEPVPARAHTRAGSDPARGVSVVQFVGRSIELPAASTQVGSERPGFFLELVVAPERLEDAASGPAGEEISRHAAYRDARQRQQLGIDVQRLVARARLAEHARQANQRARAKRRIAGTGPAPDTPEWQRRGLPDEIRAPLRRCNARRAPRDRVGSGVEHQPVRREQFETVRLERHPDDVVRGVDGRRASPVRGALALRRRPDARARKRPGRPPAHAARTAG